VCEIGQRGVWILSTVKCTNEDVHRSAQVALLDLYCICEER